MNEATQKLKERISGSEFPGMNARFLRLDRFLAMYDHLVANQPCPTCRGLQMEAENLFSDNLVESDFPEFEKRYLSLVETMTNHLKQEHAYLMPGHYRNQYALVFMVLGAIAGALLVYLGRISSAGQWSYEAGLLLGWVAGLVAGMVIGNKKDAELKKNNKFIYPS